MKAENMQGVENVKKISDLLKEMVRNSKEETLEKMLENITPEMYHQETFNDRPVGKEIL